MHFGRYELEAVPPDDCLLVVRVCPDRVECIVRTDCEVCVVADETTTELIPRVDRMSGDSLGLTSCQVSDNVVEWCVVDVIVERSTVDPSNCWRDGGLSAPLPARDIVSVVAGHVSG